MTIALASDHAGYELKAGIAEYLKARGVDFVDFGCGPGEKVDYVEYGSKAARAVVSGRCDRAILVCGTGLGMAIVANKFKGLRATPCGIEYAAEVSRSHNDSNCLALGGRTQTLELATRLVRIWLETPFEAGRHARRVQMISDLETANFK
ncbi:MAG: ribose 5-phosphate isomerase B [Acidobacteriota bacterium]